MLYLPLVLMFMLSLVSFGYALWEVNGRRGLNGVSDSETMYGSGLGGSYDGYYDDNGRFICFSNETLAAGLESGSLTYTVTYHRTHTVYELYGWKNSSGNYPIHFMYGVLDPSGRVKDNPYSDMNKEVDAATVAFSVAESGAMIGIFAATVGMVFVFGMNVVGTGLNMSATRILVYLFFFGLVWGLLTSLSIKSLIGGEIYIQNTHYLISGIPYVGWIVYFILTISYMWGVFEFTSGGF